MFDINNAMAFTNFNPPFTNATVDDFFEFETDDTQHFLELREYILDDSPEIQLGLAYHVPYFTLGKKKLFYFHYFKNEQGGLKGEISFARGKDMQDVHKLFSEKNKVTKSISLENIKHDLSLIDHYIQSAIALVA